jgi:phosphonate metabolism protein PhnN/1,5-bisphosphokinase (PRPP-forming)
MSGLWIFVCGPSGAGKDSVISWARARLQGNPKLVFARRIITRAQHPGSDHDPVTPEQFDHLVATSGLVWQWQAHGFSYGIHAKYAADVAAGKVVVVNGSREHGGPLQGQPRIRVVQISTDTEKLAGRLAQRGRENENAVRLRLARNADFADWQADHTIHNQAELAVAGLALVDYLLNFATV